MIVAAPLRWHIMTSIGIPPHAVLDGIDFGKIIGINMYPRPDNAVMTSAVMAIDLPLKGAESRLDPRKYPTINSNICNSL